MTSRCWLDIQPVPRFVFIVTMKVIVPRFDQIDNRFPIKIVVGEASLITEYVDRKE